VSGFIANAAWLIPSWLFLALVVWTIRKARARGQRLFVDGPNQRLQGLRPDTRIDHRWDA
jgi:hypothetical protein